MFRVISSPLRRLPKTLNPFPYLSSPFSHSPALEARQHEEEPNRDSSGPPRLFVVQPRLRPEPVLQMKLQEALNLANSLEEQRDGFFHTELCDKDLPFHVVVQNPASRSMRADTYFGPGTVHNVKCHLNNMESQGEVDAVFVNATLTGVQQRNLERAWEKPVLDRVGLIIEIFHAHAYTKEAKLQAELAALMYKKSRLVRIRSKDGRYTFGTSGEAEVVSARGRGSGGQGFISGAGETELELQRRRILERRKQLLSELKEVRRTRALQRASRKRHGGGNGQGMPTVAVVGYTNAGKSTLVSALSNTDLYSDDRLFATVDPKLRNVNLPSGRQALFSDTVGFISDLPVQLVEAFHATLEEVVEADLLVHVLDSSAPNLDEHRETVLQVLKQIGVSEEKLKNMVEVWNKIDLQEGTNKSLPDSEHVEIRSICGEEDDDLASEEPLQDHEELMADQVGRYSDSEVSSEEEQEIGTEIGLGPKEERLLSQDSTTLEKVKDSEIHSGPHAKTSAVMRVGLKELLEIIDDKLKPVNVVERNVFDQKWRPPRTEDRGLAVEK